MHPAHTCTRTHAGPSPAAAILGSKQQALPAIKRGGAFRDRHSEEQELIKTEKLLKKEKGDFRTAVVNMIMSGADGEDGEGEGSAMEADAALDTSHAELPASSKEAENKLQRYYYYITNGIDTTHILDMSADTMANINRMLKEPLRTSNPSLMEALGGEVREDYHMSLKRAIVEFVLKDPRQQDGVREEVGEGLLEYRRTRAQLPGWGDNYRLAVAAMQANLLLNNPTILGLQEIWKDFQGTMLMDMDGLLLRGSSFDLRAFKTSMLVRFEKMQERFYTTWFPAILNLFYTTANKKAEWTWTAIEPKRLEAFFRCVSLITADQLRHVVRQNVREFVRLFDGSVVTAASRLEGGRPVTFATHLLLEGAALRFDPSLDEVTSTLESLFDALLVSLDHIPKVETQLFSTGQSSSNAGNRITFDSLKPELYINLSFERTFPDFVREARAELRANLGKLLHAPVEHLHEYDRQGALIHGTSAQEVAHFLAGEISQEQMIEVGVRMRGRVGSAYLGARSKSSPPPSLSRLPPPLTNTNTTRHATGGEEVPPAGQQHQHLLPPDRPLPAGGAAV